MQIQVNQTTIKVLEGKEQLKQKKITGTRLATILGLNKFNTPFSAWAEMTGLYKPVIPDKYLKVGQVLEKPIIKSIEDMYDFNIKTFDKNEIKFDNFKDNPIFGGMVDGIDEEKRTLVEIKTTNVKNKRFWDKQIPIEYWYQAQLYCELARLDEILFGVCFVEEQDYADPNNIPIDDRDIRIYPVEKADIKQEMQKAIEWYKRCILSYESPKFNPYNNRDMEIVKEIKKNWRNYICN